MSWPKPKFHIQDHIDLLFSHNVNFIPRLFTSTKAARAQSQKNIFAARCFLL